MFGWYIYIYIRLEEALAAGSPVERPTILYPTPALTPLSHYPDLLPSLGTQRGPTPTPGGVARAVEQPGGRDTSPVQSLPWRRNKLS